MNDRLTRRITVTAVLVVALVAAIVSYAHMHDLAVEHGESWRAVLIPLAVDGMLVAATLAIVTTRQHHLRAGWVPWLGLTLGILASLAANVAAARPELVAQLIAAWPPVALAVSIETLVVVLRREAVTAQASTEAAERHVEPLNRPVRYEEETPTTEVLEPAPSPDPVAVLIEAGAGRRRLARELGVSEHQARQLLAQHTGNGVAR
jgi:ABC-type microcin C transport system permease subunit YejE